MKVTLEAHHLRYMQTLAGNARFCEQAISRIPGLSSAAPQGAMYMLIKIDGVTDDAAWCKDLMDKASVFVLPGVCFAAPGYFRIVTCAGRELLQEAFERIGVYMRDTHKQ